MICWISLFFSFFLFTLKDMTFFSCYLNLSSASSFMASISPLIFMVYMIFHFGHFDKIESHLFIWIIASSILLTSLTFFFSDCHLFLISLELTVPLMVLGLSIFSKDFDKFDSILFMVVMNLAGSFMFMYACTYMKTYGTFMMEAPYEPFLCVSSLIFMSYSLMLITKLPFFLLHFWLTKAHVSASGAFSMLLASLMLKLGSYGLLKYASFFKFNGLSKFSPMISCCLWLYFIFSLLMIRFTDIKHLVACSSILHMSFILPGIMILQSFSVSFSMFMMVGHGLVSYMLFFLVTILYEGGFCRSSEANQGSASLTNTFSISILLFLFFNMGVPPLINFLSEVFLCAFLVNLTLLGCLSFCFCLLPCSVFVMFIVSRNMFGKKSMFFNIMDSMMPSLGKFFTLFICVVPFLF